MSDYDVVVIGGGSAGFAAAERAVESGARVAIVEAGSLGGECPNRACVPTKILARAAEIMNLTKEAEEFGITFGTPRIDLKKTAAYRRGVIDKLTGDRLNKALEERGIDLLKGRAVFRSNHEIVVDGQTVSSEKFIISSGSRAKKPLIPGLDGVGYMTSREASEITEIPESILIVGGGPVGLEYAHIFNRLGARVVLVESNDRLLGAEDREISELAEIYACAKGIDVRTGTWVEAVGRNMGKKEARLRGRQGAEVLGMEALLVAAGREPNINGMNLEAAGVGFGPHGITVDTRLETSAKNIWACGDVTGKLFYTHAAAYQGDLAGFNATARPAEEIDNSIIPHVIHADPEVASVGVTEARARREYTDVRVGRMPYRYLGKSLILGERNGLVKLVAAGETLVGAHIIGSQAGENIHELTVAMRMGMDLTALAQTIHAYPTFAEGIAAAAAEALAGGAADEQAA